MEGDTAKHQGKIAVADAFFDGFLWVRVQRPHPNVNAIDVPGIADAAINDHTFPTILVRQNGQLVTHQGAAQRTTAIDDQHLALTGFVENLTNQRVVLKNLQRHDFAGKSRARAITLKHRGNNAYRLAEFGFVLVAEVGRLEGHDDFPSIKEEPAQTAAASLASSTKSRRT